MSDVKKFFEAAKSEGTTMESVQYFTEVDSKNGHDEAFNIFRWVYESFNAVIKNLTDKQLEDMMEGPQFCSEFTKVFKHVPNTGESATIGFAILWTRNLLRSNVKSRLHFCYAAQPGEIDGDKEVEVLMGMDFNCLIPDYITDKERVIKVYVGTAGKSVLVNILNVGLDTCELMLTSNKEG